MPGISAVTSGDDQNGRGSRYQTSTARSGRPMAVGTVMAPEVLAYAS